MIKCTIIIRAVYEVTYSVQLYNDCNYALCSVRVCMAPCHGCVCDDPLPIPFVIAEANPEKLDNRFKNKFFKVSHFWLRCISIIILYTYFNCIVLLIIIFAVTYQGCSVTGRQQRSDVEKICIDD